MTTNDYQWQPMTTNDYILATFWLFFWLHSDYILATFLLQFDCILTKFWLHSDLPIKTNQITDSCVQLVSYLFKWKGNGCLYKLVCWVRTLNFFLFIDQHSSPWSTLAIISNQQSDTQGLCSAFQDRVSSILGKEKFWDQHRFSFLEQQINCQQFDHSILIDMIFILVLSPSYRVFFSKGPTQKSSKYGIGPSQQDKIVKFTGPTQSYLRSKE